MQSAFWSQMNTVRVEVRTVGSGVHITMLSTGQELVALLTSSCQWCLYSTFPSLIHTSCIRTALLSWGIKRYIAVSSQGHPVLETNPYFVSSEPSSSPATRAGLASCHGHTWHQAWDAVPCVLEGADPWQGFVSLMGLTSLSLHNTDEDKEATQCRSTSKACPMQVSQLPPTPITTTYTIPNREVQNSWSNIVLIIQLKTNKAV